MGSGRRRGRSPRPDRPNATNQPNSSNTITCRSCGQAGHKALACPKKTKAVVRDSDVRMSELKPPCYFCGKLGHDGDVCFQNPAKPKNRIKNNGDTSKRSTSQGANQLNNKGANQQQEKIQKTDRYEKDGYLFKDRAPLCTGSERYCPICNTTAHSCNQCPTPDGVTALSYSNQACRKCCIRGHTADECQNPQQQVCGTCNHGGHKTADCKDTARSKLLEYVKTDKSRFLWFDTNEKRFLAGPGQLEQAEYGAAMSNADPTVSFMDMSAMEEDVTAKSIISWPQQTQRSPYIALTNANVKPQWQQLQIAAMRPVAAAATTQAPYHGAPFRQSTKALPAMTGLCRNDQESFARWYNSEKLSQLNAQDVAYRSKVDRSRQLYHKQNWNAIIRANKETIPTRTQLTEPLLEAVICSMARGANYWRDPYVMEALHENEVPRCNCCHEEAKIVDHKMDVIGANVDILHVVDEQPWGVFVAFGCGGEATQTGKYSWVARLPSDFDMMEGVMYQQR